MTISVLLRPFGSPASGVNVTLVGIAIGLTQTSVAFAMDTSLTGNALSLSAGSSGYSYSSTLSGMQAGSSQSSLSFLFDKSLAGIAVSSGNGTLGYSFGTVVSGIAMGIAQQNMAIVIPVWPDPATVQSGVTYGPTGAEYTGTMTGGGGGSVWMRCR